MKRLLVRSFPKKGQSVDCYLNSLATENGYSSAEFMIREYLNLTVSNTDNVSLEMVGDLTGHSDQVLESLALLPSDQHFQPTHWYGNLAIPSYHLRKEQWICSCCLKEKTYSLAKWRIAWLPFCLEHKKSLIQVNRINWCEGATRNFGDSANDDQYEDRFFHIQKILEEKLENESRGLNIRNGDESVLDIVDRYLFRAISESKASSLRDRRRKYSKRYFPIANKDIPKFMECLFTQLVG
jgi:hypothetical protein